ncbi:MAG: indole-3-glycerol phosphate synthase TrpC [Planctomycetia bacterium]|nr:indole-3-glycerol phosphate synthase TrpC [Planctomycetia bacterium]
MKDDFLKKIIRVRRERILESQQRKNMVEIKKSAYESMEIKIAAGDLRRFVPCQEGNVGIIAEIKRASPSKGIIAENINVEKIAEKYIRGGAVGISVLTEPDFFLGADEFLSRVRKVSSVPVLRKDFVISEYQIYESLVLGADMLLLIIRMLESSQLRDYVALTRELRMEPLVEIFDEADMEKLFLSEAKLVGINNRDLKTFATDVKRASELAGFLEKGQIPIIASAIHSRRDMEVYLERGINHFLVGECLMRSSEPERKLKELICGI